MGDFAGVHQAQAYDMISQALTDHGDELCEFALMCEQGLSENEPGNTKNAIQICGLYQDLLKASSEINAHRKALEEMSSAQIEGAESAEALVALLHNLREQHTSSAENVKQMSALKRQLWGVSRSKEFFEEGFPTDEDSDIEIQASQTVQTKCPITRALLTNPVQSRVCKHVFSKEGIYSLLQQKNKIKCPTAGCPKNITKADLVENNTLARKIRKQIDLEARTRTRGITMDVDFEE